MIGLSRKRESRSKIPSLVIRGMNEESCSRMMNRSRIGGGVGEELEE